MGEYLKLSIVIKPTDPWRDLLTQDLGDFGFESFETVDKGLLAYIPKEHFEVDQYGNIIDYKSKCDCESC